MGRVIKEFHHEQAKHTQITFAEDVKALTAVIEKMGNPFCDDSRDLLVLDSKDLSDPAVMDTLHHIEKLEQERYKTYVNERLVNQTEPIVDTIKKKPFLSSADHRSEKSKTKLR